MFSIKLTARPDARMVEVPLDIEVELPREFDGAAVLVSSGMPRKVKLRAPKDSIKLSTAYRIDQLVADLVRQILRGQPPDVQRAQDAGFIRKDLPPGLAAIFGGALAQFWLDSQLEIHAALAITGDEDLTDEGVISHIVSLLRAPG